MDNAIKEFKQHLICHPRTILSAKFGDGKSYFLSAAEKKLKNSHVFLKLYPVNYQVADNQDIFEYIKRDLLFQLYGQGMVPESYEIPDSIASYFFLRNNWQSFATEILQGLSYFDASNTIKATVGAAKFLCSMKKKYDEFKKNGGELGVFLDKFIVSFDKKGIYEADPITSILCDIVNNWKKAHNRRKVCLVFEDMDRIDPSHIFRILNVISAQMDYAYKYGVSPKGSLAGNKFGVDNIVVCLDYDNLKSIFNHFYGQRACFDGYINKFSDRGIFQYSLKDQVYKYYLSELARVTGMEEAAIKAICDQFDFSQYTLRQLYHAIDDVGKQICLPVSVAGIVPHRGLFIISAVLRRLGVSTEEILSALSQAFRADVMAIGPYVGTCMMLKRNMKQGQLNFSFGDKDKGYLVVYSITDYHDDGLAVLDRRLYGSWSSEEKFFKPIEEIDYILGFVSK